MVLLGPARAPGPAGSHRTARALPSRCGLLGTDRSEFSRGLPTIQRMLLFGSDNGVQEGERSSMAEKANSGRQREFSGGRQEKIVDVLVDAFSELMLADPEAFRQKFRKMAASPFAFYRGSACL